MNDTERRQWVENDEGLYDLWKWSHVPIREFVRENRELIDSAIVPVLENKAPAHWLKYGK